MTQDLEQYFEQRLFDIRDDIQWGEERLEKAEKDLANVKIYDEDGNLTETYKDAKAKVDHYLKRLNEYSMELNIFYTARDIMLEQ